MHRVLLECSDALEHYLLPNLSLRSWQVRPVTLQQRSGGLC